MRLSQPGGLFAPFTHKPLTVVHNVGLSAPFKQTSPSIGIEFVTVKVVHGPQLLSSSDSAIVPVSEEELLSAQARIEYSPTVAKV